jgi:vitamin B12 transporter
MRHQTFSSRSLQLIPSALLLLGGTGPLWAQTAIPELGEVVVTASRQPTRTNELLSDVTVIGREEIEAAGPAAAVIDVLGRQPGVEIYRSGGLGAASNVMIRGTASKHTLLLVDGVRMGSATTGYASWAHIPLLQVDRIEILRGAASSLYGSDAIGGVVQIFTRKGQGPLKVFAETGFGSHHTSASNVGFSGGQNGWSYALQAGYQDTHGISATNKKNGYYYHPDHDRFHETSASGSLSYTFAKDQELGLKFFHSDGRTHYDSGAPDYWEDGSVSSVQLYSFNRFASFWTSTLRIGRSADHQNNFSDGVSTGKYDTNQTQYQWQNDFTLPVGTALLAFERQEDEIDTNAATGVYGKPCGPLGLQFCKFEKRHIDSIVAGWKGNFGAHRLQFDLRRDDNSQYGDKTTGFAAYGYQFTPAWRANLSYGTAFKAPTFNDLYYPPDAWGDVGNPDLKPESAKNKEIAIHYESGLHHASVTAYQNDIEDMINWMFDSSTFLYQPQNIAKARVRGITLAYDGILYGLDVRAGADFQDPRDREVDKVATSHSRRHGSLSIGQRNGPYDWNVEWQVYSKRYTDRLNTQTLGGYGLVNLQAGYRFAPDWSVFARANNLFDKKYEFSRGYNTDGANFFVGIRYQPK